MAEANFNLVLDAEARYAAEDIRKRLNIPWIELTRLYQMDKIARQYELFAAAIGVKMDDSVYRAQAEAAVEDFRKKYPKLTFSVGEGCNSNAFELSLALLRYGFSVAEIFSSIGENDFLYLEKIAKLSPQTRVYSNLEPTINFITTARKHRRISPLAKTPRTTTPRQRIWNGATTSSHLATQACGISLRHVRKCWTIIYNVAK